MCVSAVPPGFCDGGLAGCRRQNLTLQRRMSALGVGTLGSQGHALPPQAPPAEHPGRSVDSNHISILEVIHSLLKQNGKSDIRVLSYM